jgi:O-antigen/teichoic acid export membrane protein
VSSELRNKLVAQILLAITQIAFPIVTYPVITRSLGPAGLGTVNFADAIIQAFLVLGSIGIPVYGIREIAIHKNNPTEQSAIFSRLFLIQLMALIPTAGIIWITGTIAGADHRLLVLGIIVIACTFFSFEWFLQGHDKFIFIAYRTIITKILSAVFIYLLINDKTDYVLYYSILVGAVALNMLFNLTLIVKITTIQFVWSGIIKQLYKLNWVYGCYIFASWITLVDSIILGWISSNESVGYYSFGYRLVRMSSMIIPVIGSIFVPQIAFLFNTNNRAALEKQTKQSLEIIFFAGVPLSVFFLLLAPELVAVFSGGIFQRTIDVIRILSPIPLLAGLSHFAGSQILLPTRREKVYFIILSIGVLINFSVDIIFIPAYMEKAAAVSNVMVEFFIVIAGGWYLINKKLVSIPLKQLINSIIASLILIPVVYLLRYFDFTPLLTVIVSVVTVAVVYTFVYLTFSDNQSQVRKLFSLKQNA